MDLGNIIPRILNYAVLTVYYTRKFPPEKYGVITELYAYVAIFTGYSYLWNGNRTV